MKRFLLFGLCSLFFLTKTEDVSAQGNEQSMLWRISGNGLTEPSYLFGTMHVKNRKAFYFKDSLYHFLEKATGFAMEFHPDSSGQLFTALAEGRIDLEDLDFSRDFDDEAFEKIISKFQKDKKGTFKTKKEKAGFLIEKLLEDEEDSTSMDTFMDAWLYGLALQNGKMVFGLEEVDDQLRAFKSLAKGIKLQTLAELADEDIFKGSPPVYDYYYKERLDSIERYFTRFFSEATLKDFLYDRNIGMAHQMDSLMKRQTMFCAMGAGHLPGTKGVIALLRKKGYTVEPVFSANRLFAGDYKKKTIVKNWNVHTNSTTGYRVQMPGKITVQQGGQGREVAYSVYLPEGLVFMSISGKLSSAEKKIREDSVSRIHINEMLETFKGYVISRKEINVNGLSGFEVTAGSLGNGYSRIIELFEGGKFYVLTLSSEKKSKLESELGQQYINTFETFAPEPLAWKTRHSPEDGFSAEMPVNVVVKPLKNDDDTPGTVNSYMASDGNTGISYTIYVTRNGYGADQSGANWYFYSYIEQLRQSTGADEIEQTDTLIAGYPAKWLHAKYYNDQVAEGLVISRGNLNYVVFAEYDSALVRHADIGRFFNSFRFVAFPPAAWKEQVTPDDLIAAWAPGEFEEQAADTSYVAVPEGKIFYARDPYYAAEVKITITPFNKYYWAENIDSVYSYWHNKDKNYADSVISYTVHTTDGIPSREMVLFNTLNKIKIRKRYIINGDAMIEAEMVIPPSFEDKANEDRFFVSLRILKKENISGILTNDPVRLFTDLQSSDSAVFYGAYQALNEVTFRLSHFDMLLEHSLHRYPMYNNIYQSANQRIFMILTNLAEKDVEKKIKLREFIRQQYVRDDKVIAENRFHLLAMLAGHKDSASFALISRLMTTTAPAGEDPYLFYYKLDDSIKLNRFLFPALLQLVPDSVNGIYIMSLVKELIDSNLLSINDILPVQEGMLRRVKTALQKTLKLSAEDYDYDYELPDALQLLGYFKNKTANELIAGYLKVKIPEIRMAALLTLIRNGWPVSTADISKSAANDQYRLELYEELVKLKKPNLFPSEYATQQAMGKSYIYNRMIEWDELDEGVADFIYIRKKDIMYEGRMRRFILYRLNFGSEQEKHTGDPELEDTYSYLAIAGPFETDAKKLTILPAENSCGVYYDAKFDGLQLDLFFDKYIKSFLKNKE